MLRLRLFQSKTRGITILRANSRFQSLAFPRRFPIIRYLTRVPLSRSYVTQRRVSVRVFPKRFMNYVDGSVRGRGCVYVYMERIHHGKRFWTVLAECCLYGIWWIGICIVRKKRVEISSFHFIESSAQSLSTTHHADFSCRAYSKRSSRDRMEGENRVGDGKRFLFSFSCEFVWEYSKYSSVVSHLFEVLIYYMSL